MAKQPRSKKLIADFDPDPHTLQFRRRFARGWAMAVGTWFAASLDIQLTERLVRGQATKKRTGSLAIVSEDHWCRGIFAC